MTAAARDAMTPAERRAGISLAAIFALRMLGLFLVLPVFAVFAKGLPGGDDLDPALWGGKPSTCYEPSDPRRTKYELDLTLAAIQRDKPLLGICLGAQLLNVACGGSLRCDLDLTAFPDAKSIESLRGVGVTYVVVHTDAYDADKWRLIEQQIAQTPALKLEHIEGAGRAYSLLPQ